MRFFVISDLHLLNTGNILAEQRMQHICCQIRKDIPPTENILFVLMGDYANGGQAEALSAFEDFLALIRKELSDYSVEFHAIPGNHDLMDGSINTFSEFAFRHGISCISNDNPVYAKKYGKTNMIFADSTLGRIHNKPGQLDYEAIKSHICPDSKNILFCHHAITQDHGGNHDTVVNPSSTIQKLEDIGIDIVFHAHTHQADLNMPFRKIVEVGCGSFSGDLSEMPGIYHQFMVGNICPNEQIVIERFIDSKDGTGGFAVERMWPSTELFKDPDTIFKEEYAPVPEYEIPRKIISHDEFLHDASFSFYTKYETLDEAIKQYNILLLADAGQGKSIALQNLAYQLFSTSYFPFLYNLSEYTGQSILELLPSEYVDLQPSLRILIFDGFDEIIPEKRNIFINSIATYSRKYPDSRILISSRSNFCKTEQNNESKTFKDFKVFDLCKLSQENILSYLEHRNIDTKNFFKEASRVNVHNLCENPFYLTRLASIYVNENKLPQKNDLMEKLIQDCFEKDNDKFPGDLEENYSDLFKLLERIAYAMQLMKVKDFDDRTQYQELFVPEERKLAKMSSLLYQSGDKWHFVHNNFREYLVARYLSKLPKEKVISLLYAENEVKPSWLNTLGYYIEMNLEWDGKKWFCENAPKSIISLESDRNIIDESMKTRIFKEVFMSDEKKQLWLSNALHDAEKLAKFGCNYSTLQFLLDKIDKPVNIFSLENALIILSCFPRLYGQKNKICDLIIETCIKYKDISPRTCNRAIYAIGKLKLYSEDITVRLMAMFSDSSSDYIRYGMYDYLLSSKQHNQYVDFFLNGIKCVNNSENRLGNELFSLEKGLKAMDTVSSVTAALNWFSDNINVNFFGDTDIFEVLCETAAKLYSQAKEKIYNIILKCYISASTACKTNFLNSSLRFFEVSGTLEKATLEIMNISNDNVCAVHELIYYGPKPLNYIADAYSKGTLKDKKIFPFLIQRYVTDPEKYGKFSAIIEEHEGWRLPELQAPTYYKEQQRKQYKLYFDMLFDKTLAEKMILDIIAALQLTEPTVEEIANVDLSIDMDYSLLNLRFRMRDYVPADTKATDFCAKVNWNIFMITEAFTCISQEYVSPSPEHLDRLLQAISPNIKYYIEKLPNSMVTMASIKFSIRYGWKFANEIMLSMTELPAYHFDDDYSTEKKYEYLEKYIPISELKERIIVNVRNIKLDPYVLQDHFEFLALQNCDDVLDAAIKICMSEHEDALLKHEALKYVYKFTDWNYIATEILRCADTDFALEIIGLYKESPNKKDFPQKIVRDILEQKFNQSQDMNLLPCLIELESKVAIDKYVEIAITTNKIPPRSNALEYPTEAIEKISNKEFLPQLTKLMNLIFADGFQDGDFYTVSNAVAKAFLCCSINAYKEVKDILLTKIDNSADNSKSIHWCNCVLQDIEQQRLLFNDRSMELEMVKKIIDSDKSI